MKTTNNNNTKFAAVGTDGERLVVWGIGETEESALADAYAQDFGGADFRPDLGTFVIDAMSAAAVAVGHVACEIRKGRVVLV